MESGHSEEDAQGQSAEESTADSSHIRTTAVAPEEGSTRRTAQPG